MTAALITATVKLGTGLSRLSLRNPDVRLTIRPLGFRWAVRCSGPAGALEGFRGESREEAALFPFGVPGETSWCFAYAPRSAETALLRRLAASDAFVLPPLVLQGGALRVRFLSPTGRLPAPLRGYGPSIELASRQPLTAERLGEELEHEWSDLPRLTIRQSEVMAAAVRMGYYEVPRRTDVKRIARQLSLGRSTVEEHLRSAESSLIRFAAGRIEPLSMHDADENPAQPLEHYSRFCSEIELYVDLALRGDRVAEVHLRHAPPAPRSRRSHPHLERILEHIRTGKDDLRSIPVDLRVTPFERSVLEELRRIPPGETRTYSEIARRIGEPGAVRAVGNACAHNPAVVVIPCHRVVPAGGGIGNYSATGGPRTKRLLLEREGALADPSTRDPARSARSEGPHDPD